MSAKNYLRAALGQGVGMGWGDEAEAWLRSRMDDQDYSAVLDQIRREYGDFAEENPWGAGLAEFGGAALPGAAMMLLPGGQPAAMGIFGRAVGAGALSGAVSGAGTAEEESRASGALLGGTAGAAIGAAIPAVGRSASEGMDWLRQRIRPSDAVVQRAASQRMNRAMQHSQLTPQDLLNQNRMDITLGVPGIAANASPELAKLAEQVAQRAGAGSAQLERSIVAQGRGSRGRVDDQARAALRPGNYYADEEQLVSELRDKAKDLYGAAYAYGEVDDPRIMQVLSKPQFRGFYDQARKIADLEATAAGLRGEDPSSFALREIYRESAEPDPAAIAAMRAMGMDDATIARYASDIPRSSELISIPDVRTLDYIKRGMDAAIESGFKGQGMSTAEAKALRDVRKEFVNALDENVPDYKTARAGYAGDMEVLDALRAGMNDFNAMDHEQVQQMVRGMSTAELDAYRTGVSRHLYAQTMDPSNNFDAAKRIVNSPETMQKLRPLFKNESEFGLFTAALERESEIFRQAGKILGGSQTSMRAQMREEFERDPVGSAAHDLIQGGVDSTLTGLVLRAIRSASVTEPIAERLGKMLSAGTPDEIAAVVTALESAAQAGQRRAVQAGTRELGAITGAAGSHWPAPQPSEEE